MTTKTEDKTILPHHIQQPLCTTRLPYRQGRKLTAVKVYTVNSESNHLLIFGVPSLNLRQETKTMFSKFGKLTQFHISTTHPAEQFTETYHAVYEQIRCARMAKRMLDTKNYYGGSLHICYSPELETVEETKEKLEQRRRDVLYRLRNLEKDKANDNCLNKCNTEKEISLHDNSVKTGSSFIDTKKLNMGEVNTISLGKQTGDEFFKRKRQKPRTVTINKKFKPCFIEKDKEKQDDKEVEIVDCTSTDKETISNINEALNYNKFGNEVIRKVPVKPLNVIKFNFEVNKR